ncbi:MAG TPA: TetR-like C-terminal domain-containing protein [Streptosporangiaceae bacterium]|jgi:AcrR family transcriptional regulator|nr:TetR-like C-terminal domain-containing protein [Streptosporangiaceae bacterium]
MRPRNAAVAREPGHRGRRSSSDVEEAILAATLEILDEAGFEDLTIEAVAARAGAAKTAVYRRWPSKVPLVVEALTRSGPQFEVPDTGSLRTDLIVLWHRVSAGGVRSIERLLPVVTTYLDSRDDLMDVMRDRYFRPRLQATRAVITRAVARSEIRADVDPELAFDLLFGPLAYRWLRGSPPDEDTIGRLTGLALKGLEPGGLEARDLEPG